jgi:hypothetical protein
MLTLADKMQNNAVNFGDIADKYLESKEQFCFITGSAFLCLSVLLFLKIVIT